MKTTSALSIFTVFMIVTATAYAAPEKFSCERIKEKAVRNACTEERVTKERAETAERARISEVEKEQKAGREKEALAIAEAKKASEEFVNKSKQLLTQNLKDPDSAKFSDLVIAQSAGHKLLCGAINAKNSYGGYVGAKKFYVLWQDATPGTPVVYTTGDEVARASARMDELSKVGRSAGLSAQISAAQEGDEVLAKARIELAQNSKILAEQCTASVSTTILPVEK